MLTNKPMKLHFKIAKEGFCIDAIAVSQNDDDSEFIITVDSMDDALKACYYYRFCKMTDIRFNGEIWSVRVIK